MATDEDDITIGPGKLLGLFFMLVAICGVFFAIGYSLGKTSAREQALNDKAPLSASLSAPVIGESGGAKPSAVVPASNEAEPAASPDEAKKQAPDLTFYDAVKKTDHPTAATEAAPATPGKAAQAKPVELKTARASPPPSTNAPASSLLPASASPRSPQTADAKPVAAPVASGAFVVQIAAVTREEDAAALAGALRKKNYSVFVVNNPAVHDKFYHVQVGPFETMQDAEAMKAKLTGEGYNPIVKRS